MWFIAMSEKISRTNTKIQNKLHTRYLWNISLGNQFYYNKKKKHSYDTHLIQLQGSKENLKKKLVLS